MSEPHKPPEDLAAWDQRYVDGPLPWDTGRPDVHLPGVVKEHITNPGKALEIGCGTGTNAIWLAQHGFDVTGLDLSQTAVKRAKAKCAEAGIDCHLFAADFLVEQVPDPPFQFVYDRGCFHVFQSPEERTRYASRVRDLLEPEGIWHSLIGSTDGPPRDTGPPRHSARDVTAAVEPYFEILELRSTTFHPHEPEAARAWVLVARRRADVSVE